MHQKEVIEVFRELDSSKDGLSNKEADKRLQKYGFNQLEAKEKINPIKIFLSQFYSPLIWILLLALGVSIFLHESVNGIIIGIIVLLNSTLGFIQEYKAGKAIESLKKLSSHKAKVLRDGKIHKIDSKDLVPGDIIFLEMGDKIPADARLFEIHNLEVMESNLTGESLPISKTLEKLPEKTSLADRTNMVYSTTIVTIGRATAVVTETGMKTEVGKIAKLISEEKNKMTPFQIKLDSLGKYITIGIIILAIIIFISGISAGKEVIDMFFVSVVLAVSAIPEGLPAVITISLSLAVKRLIKKNVLVRKLPSVETLGSVDVICVDKTGTLTYNQMTVVKSWANNLIYDLSGSGYNPNGIIKQGKREIDTDELGLLFKIGFLCNDAKIEGVKNKREVVGDPTEGALIVSAEKANLPFSKIIKEEPRIEEIPFTSERKMMTTLHRSNNKIVSYTKGAPDILLNFCDRINIKGKISILTAEKRKEILKQNKDFAGQSLRLLGFAYKENTSKKDAEKNMIFVGIQGMIDPPRNEVKESIKRCLEAGIRVIMITGDHPDTARTIAKEIGIKGEVITGRDLEKINLKKEINHIGVFARVNPADKLKIVKALKNNNHIVAMTGDGINDAPALKKADIGVAMGISGTDVSKEASDMILVDDNFTSIVNAVEEGRGIFDNIRKFVNYLISSNMGEIVLIFFATLFGLPLPLTALQILWINLVTDGLPATALSVDPYSPLIMKEKPRHKKENIISKRLGAEIIVIGLLIGLIGLGLFSIYHKFEPFKAQTIVFTSLVVFELVRIQIIRSSYRLSFFSNKHLLWALSFSFLLQLITIYTPLNRWFGTTPLNLLDLGIIISSALVLLVAYRIIYHFILRKISHI